jgi:small subunit ribosomal protein S4
MGDIKRPKKQYRTPNHPWNKKRIEEEKELIKEYGFVNKKEIWGVQSILLDFKKRAKMLIPLTGEKANITRTELIMKLNRLGILKETASIDEILSLTFRDVADRRLQSLVFRKALSHSIKQARQFITHGHIKVSSKKITAPSYIVLKEEEDLILFSENSSLADVNHPERAMPKREVFSKEKVKDIESKDNSDTNSENK